MNALFWTRGEANEELLSLLLEMENSNGLQIKPFYYMEYITS